MYYEAMTIAQLEQEYNRVLSLFADCKAKKLNLNMACGKPAKAQLDLCKDILTVLSDPSDCFDGNIDARNYGDLAGLPCARAYWADLLGCKPEQTFVGGSASLNLMYDVISKAYTHGLLHSERPWCKEEKIKFLCPAPGYDRHFRITESFGAELITIPMTATGPDMDLVEAYAKDPAVKGIWCVPKYSNPDGIIYSDETIRRFASLKPAAPDFALMWDNACAIHDLGAKGDKLADIFALSEKYGTEDRVFYYTSFSKVTYAGGAIAMMAMSLNNINIMKPIQAVRTIGYDKINQLRHLRFLKDEPTTRAHMQKHAAIVNRKFDILYRALEEGLGDLDIATWSKAKGGYFISLNAMDGCAKRIHALCKEAGVVLTPAGATFPYGRDPRDRNLRLAPTFPPDEELKQAAKVLVCAIKIASIDRLLGR